MPRSLTRLVPFSFLTRRRWTAEDARAVLDHLESSGLSVREFAAQEGLDAQRIYRWRAQLRSGGRSPAPAFVEIRPAVTAAIEVVLHSGHVLRVREGFGEETLRRLVAALEEPGTRC